MSPVGTYGLGAESHKSENTERDTNTLLVLVSSSDFLAHSESKVITWTAHVAFRNKCCRHTTHNHNC